jgi:hypothetical protein
VSQYDFSLDPLIHWFLDTLPSFGNLNRLQKLFVGLAIMMVATSPLAFGVANTDVAILAEKVKADKTLLVCINMALTHEEARDFWPLYDADQKELHTVN